MSDTVTRTIKKASQEITIPDSIIVKPIESKRVRLGLEKTKENFTRLPGVRYRWAPTRRGTTYLTGLQYITPSKRIELEKQLGLQLDDSFYSELTYVMDGSNPNGHLMDLKNDPMDLIVYLCFIESELIAVSRTQFIKGLKPFAEWYIEDNEVEAEEQEKVRDKVMEVYRVYNEISNSRRAIFAKLMGINVYGVSDKVAAAKLWTVLTDRSNEKARTTDKFIDKFIEIAKYSDERLIVSAEVEDAIIKNILRRNGAQDWVYADTILGSTKEQVISKLLQGDNGQVRISIKEKLALQAGQ